MNVSMPKLDFGRLEQSRSPGLASPRTDSPRGMSIAAQKDKARSLLANRQAKQKMQIPASPRVYKYGNSSTAGETSHTVEHRRMAAALATERARANEEVQKVKEGEHATQASLQQQVTPGLAFGSV